MSKPGQSTLRPVQENDAVVSNAAARTGGPAVSLDTRKVKVSGPGKKNGASKRRAGRKIQNRRTAGAEELTDVIGLGDAPTWDPRSAKSTLLAKIRAGDAGVEDEDKSTICQDILVEGYVQSFVDFFYLTHQADAGGDPSTDAAKSEQPELSLEDLRFLKDTLIAAEEARRQGSTPSVFASYEALAQYYQARDDPKTGIYFYERCLEISKLTGDPRGEMRANHRLGNSYSSSGDFSTAKQYHERSLALAHAQGEDEEVKLAFGSLVGIYRQIGESLEKEGSYGDSIAEYEKCLEAARRAGNISDEGDASYRLGRVHCRNDNAQQALSYLATFDKICQELKDLEGQGKAQAALASAFETIGDHDKCVECLQKFMDIATRSEDLSSQAEACRALGIIYHRRGEFHSAVNLFEKNFSLCRSMASSGMGSPALLDSSRILVGLARGNARLKEHIFEITSDLSSLLDWKLAKVGGMML
mmetsp:Transcript_6427/g.18136  ORF Transcript_6427/g.18136 Transcript_6427/m.18136 type:complete len:473 (-) Transcript_6427:2431-3849(-)|eukprot:CAMPEP_0118862540 /NCGR_PEP_ID=MMETSP1163-20130328/7703_1 /TAXON_ID=124430 /ORGANISM="Phaeomonas parva, Strain CCMP2877" /LENGTH=472 /DNA_ID=CAMNT_0006796455 /DNA_START=219 /DNA_END=1637 /DNA_ORIENTATION=+